MCAGAVRKTFRTTRHAVVQRVGNEQSRRRGQFGLGRMAVQVRSTPTSVYSVAVRDGLVGTREEVCEMISRI